MDDFDFSDDIIFKALEGGLSEKEQNELSGLLAKDADFKKRHEQISRAWYYGKYTGKWNQMNEVEAWNSIMNRRAGKLRRKWLGWSVAASVLFVLGVAAISFMKGFDDNTVQVAEMLSGNESGAYLVLASGEKMKLGGSFEQEMQEGIVIQGDSAKLVYKGEILDSEEKYNELVVPNGGEYQLRLSDGTVVYLNAGSRLKYPVSFGSDCRKVELEGEGYFEVAPEATRPFIVCTQELNVNVLGTGFNVASYEDESEVAVTLVHGKIAVENKEKSVVLIPDEQLVFNRHNKEMMVQKVDAKMIAAWTKGILVFDSMPLSELAVKLGRWFDVDFFFTSEKLKQLRFTGTVRRYSDIEYILSLIESTTNIRLSLKGSTIVVENK